MKRTTLLLLVFLTICLQSVISQQKINSSDFYETDKIQDIRITFEMDNWRYMLDSLRLNGDDLLEGTVDINGEKFEGAGIQYRGTKSFTLGGARNPFNILLDHKNKGQNIQGYTTLKLSNSLRDPSMVREVLGYEIARKYMPAPKANYARLYVNDEYYGLMVNIESVQDATFRKRYFGEAGNAFFKANEVHTVKGPAGCKNNIYGSLEYDDIPVCYDINFEKLSEGGTKSLIQLTKTLNEDTKNIESILDVDVALWMLAYNNVLVNLSSYTGNKSVNYYLYQNSKGQFTPIVWDMNLSFGSFKNIGGGSDLRTRQLITLDPMLHEDNPAKPLISKLLANEKYRKLYLSHMRTILYDNFVSEKYEERAKELQELIRTDFSNDPNKFYTVGDFNASLDKVIGKHSKIPGIVWLMSKRTSYLRSLPSLAIFPPDIMNVEVETRKPLSNKQVENFHITAKIDKFPKRVALMYRLNGTGEFQSANMTDNGKADDGITGNGVFGTTIVPKSGERSIEYYIIAENAGLFSYSPAAYMWEHHSTTLDELNK